MAILGAMLQIAAAAQPTLPDLTVKAGEHTVTLSWVCQYDKLQSITVRRSSDSLSDYRKIAELRPEKKGKQGYTDPEPLTGRSFYKLLITFGSGLTWSSNYVGVTMKAPEPAAPPPLPSREPQEPLLLKAKVGSLAATPVSDERYAYHAPTPNFQVSKLSDSMMLHGDTIVAAQKPLPRRLHYTVAPDTAVTPELFMHSRHITTDETTGDVLITFSESLKLNHYSARFYDADNRLLWTLPRIKEQMMIMDRRNFQHSGTYLMILKKDGKEEDRGNFVIR